MSSGAALAADLDSRPAGWDVASVRFEPLPPGTGPFSVVGTGTYRGAVEVRRNGRSLAVVNDVDLEDYVRGIDEVPPSWPAAALQAQAIAARTYGVHMAASREATPWRAAGAEICASSRCQVYRGLAGVGQAPGSGWLTAVQATAGQVLLSGGRPILASYSASANSSLAMSQYGALHMANAGRSASEILSAYYGLRPTRAPGQLPATIRVALSTTVASAVIAGTGSFRVVDGMGAVLADAATGEWKVLPAGEGVRVIPPASYVRQVSIPTTAPAPATVRSAIQTAELVVDLRRPGRIISAASTPPALGLWPVPAALAVVGSGAAAALVDRRRRQPAA